MDREKALDKVRKLMNLANNDAAEGNEVDNALRQAESLMKKFAIDMAEAVQQGKKLSFDWQEDNAYFGKGNKNSPIWYQWMAVAVAKFTDTICVGSYHFEHGAGVKFRGNGEDVVFATWLIDSLKEQLRRATRDAKCGSPENRETFRKAFAHGVVRKITELREKRDAEMKATHGNALVVVNTKLVERDAHFGGEKYRTSKTRWTGDATTFNKGFTAGKNANVNRPVEHQARKAIA